MKDTAFGLDRNAVPRRIVGDDLVFSFANDESVYRSHVTDRRVPRVRLTDRDYFG